jgi:hypothetical protein
MPTDHSSNDAPRGEKVVITVNISTRGDSVNRHAPCLSKQQHDILDVIALLEPDERGRYATADIGIKMVEPGDRSGSASVSRAVVRLEGRGLIRREHKHCTAKKHGAYRFSLTEAGLEVVNGLRARHGLGPLELINLPPKPPMTAEEFRAELRRISAESNLLRAKDAAGRLDPEGLQALRQWIDARLAGGAG